MDLSDITFTAITGRRSQGYVNKTYILSFSYFSILFCFLINIRIYYKIIK